jgi:hypothetical protein
MHEQPAPVAVADLAQVGDVQAGKVSLGRVVDDQHHAVAAALHQLSRVLNVRGQYVVVGHTGIVGKIIEAQQLGHGQLGRQRAIGMPQQRVGGDDRPLGQPFVAQRAAAKVLLAKRPVHPERRWRRRNCSIHAASKAQPTGLQPVTNQYTVAEMWLNLRRVRPPYPAI